MITRFSQQGSLRISYTTDAVVVEELTDRHVLMAVLDGEDPEEEGCFSAALCARVLRKIARQASLRFFVEKRQPTPGELLPAILEELLTTLRDLRPVLGVDPGAWRVALALAVVDHHQARAEAVVIGNAAVACDEEVLLYARVEPPPDLGELLLQCDFSDWWAQQTQRIQCRDFLDFALATDGIWSFRLFSPDPYRPVSQEEINRFLLTARDGGDPTTLYQRHVSFIRQTYGQEPADDFSIVRLLR